MEILSKFYKLSDRPEKAAVTHGIIGWHHVIALKISVRSESSAESLFQCHQKT
jgi:hypothetical protein